jgi:hypothetical protein
LTIVITVVDHDDFKRSNYGTIKPFATEASDAAASWAAIQPKYRQGRCFALLKC